MYIASTHPCVVLVVVAAVVLVFVIFCFSCFFVLVDILFLFLLWTNTVIVVLAAVNRLLRFHCCAVDSNMECFHWYSKPQIFAPEAKTARLALIVASCVHIVVAVANISVFTVFHR